MQEPCNGYKMDVTDSRMGPEQRCKNCGFAKKEHSYNNPQTTQSNIVGNKISELTKKFSAGNQPVAPNVKDNPQLFTNQIKNSIAGKKEQTVDKQHSQPQISQQDSFPYKKILSDNFDNEPVPEYGRQNVQIVDSQQTIIKSNSAQIEVPPPVRVQQNPFLQKDNVMKESMKSPSSLKQDQTQPALIKISQNAMQPTISPTKLQEQAKSSPTNQKPLQTSPKVEDTKIEQSKTKALKEEMEIEKKEEQQNLQNPLDEPKVEDPKEEKQKIEAPEISEPTTISNGKEEVKQDLVKEPIKQEQNGEKLKLPVKPQSDIIPVRPKAQSLQIMGFGLPPPKKPQIQKEPESYTEEQLIDRPTIKKNHARVVQQVNLDD